MSDNDVFNSISMVMNVDPEEIAKIVHSYIEMGISCDYDRLNCPKPPIYIGPVKIKTLKERLEEATMHADCEDCVKRDICTRDVPKPCRYRYTEEERIADQASDNWGTILSVLSAMYLPKTYNKEENKMKATSKQVIKNVTGMEFEFLHDPIEETKLTMDVHTNDDIFEFVFVGEGVNKASRLFGPNEDMEPAVKDEVEKLKQHLKQVEDDKERLTDRHKALTIDYKIVQKSAEYWADKAKKLEKAFKFEKVANEAQHKFIREYAGKSTEVQFNYVVNESENEVSYVIVDKKTYDEKPNINLHGKDFTPDELVDRVLELEEENNRLKHEDMLDKNAADYWSKEHDTLLERFAKLQEENDKLKQLKTSSRADILDQAKKCVCGQREQDYGTPESNFQFIADLWNDYLKKERLGRSKTVVDAVDVSMMMALLKIARIRNGGGSGDSFVDLAGYAACGGEIWGLQKETK